MTEPDPVRRSQIDRHIQRALSEEAAVELPLARETLHESHDRWYGQLVVTVYGTLSDRQNPELALPAGAAVELLRGYVRLRSRLLLRLTERHAHSFTLDPTAALLAGDYLYTAAFSSLGSLPDSRSGDCFEILTTALETITGAFARTHTPAGSTEHDRAMFFDDIAGALGEAATVLGATLAGFDGTDRRHLEQFGRGLSTARQIGIVLDTAPTEAMVVPPTLDEAQLRKRADRRRDDADQALDALSETVDVTRLRTLSEVTESNRSQRGSATDDEALD